MKNIAVAVFGLTPLFAAVGALAQDLPPPPPETTCAVDADCPAGSSCLLPGCASCDPSTDPTCTATECPPGICVEDAPTDPPTETPCTTDADCAGDQFCALYDCAQPCDETDPACEPVDCGGGGVCQSRGEPPPPSCASDADCADGDVCITGINVSCSGSGCACPSDGDDDPSNDPPCDCSEPSEPECTNEAYAFCGPRWLDECAADADCGPGFTCEQIGESTCSVDSDGNTSCSEPEGPTHGYCNLVRVECTDDTDCSDGFLCVDEATAEPCAVDETGASSCEAPEATKICAPPGYEQLAPVAAEEGSERTNDDAAADDDANDGTNGGGDFVINCAQGNAASLSPLAALGLLLLRRRRR